jgi:hypothetical protein
MPSNAKTPQRWPYRAEGYRTETYELAQQIQDFVKRMQRPDISIYEIRAYVAKIDAIAADIRLAMVEAAAGTVPDSAFVDLAQRVADLERRMDEQDEAARLVHLPRRAGP